MPSRRPQPAIPARRLGRPSRPPCMWRIPQSNKSVRSTCCRRSRQLCRCPGHAPYCGIPRMGASTGCSGFHRRAQCPRRLAPAEKGPIGRRHQSGALGSPQFPALRFFRSNSLWFSISSIWLAMCLSESRLAFRPRLRGRLRRCVLKLKKP